MAFGWLVGAIDAVAVDLSRVRIGEVTMPDFVAVFRQYDAFQFGLAGAIKQAQFNLGGVRREQREVNTQTVPSGAQWKWVAFGYP